MSNLRPRTRIPGDSGIEFPRLRSTFQSHRARLARRLAERPAAVAMPPGVYDAVFDHLDAELAGAHRDLTEAEHAYTAAEVRVGELRRELQQATTELCDQHSAIEGFCRSQPGLRGAGVVGRTQRDPQPLVQQAELTLEFFRELENAGDAPVLTSGVGIDAGAVAQDLAANVPRLKAAMVVLDQAQAEVVYTRERANLAFLEAGWVAARVAGALAGLSGLAGEEKLAGKIQRGCG